MIPKIPFGRTGHLSSRTLFGAAAFWSCGPEEAERVLDLLLRHGINHIDVAPNYGGAEVRIGGLLGSRRDDFFLATKTKLRTYREAREQFDQSLERLGVERVDLLQLHNLADPEQWEVAMGPGGALEAAVEAREQGLVRFIGVTGHGLGIPAMHLRSLERFDFDSVLMPCNFALMQNPQYRADFEAVVKICGERNVAVQTIKSIARGPWGAGGKKRETWYEPLGGAGRHRPRRPLRAGPPGGAVSQHRGRSDFAAQGTGCRRALSGLPQRRRPGRRCRRPRHRPAFYRGLQRPLNAGSPPPAPTFFAGLAAPPKTG